MASGRVVVMLMGGVVATPGNDIPSSKVSRNFTVYGAVDGAVHPVLTAFGVENVPREGEPTGTGSPVVASTCSQA